MAGGQSRCFGRDKSLALLKGKPLLEHVLESLQHLFEGVSLIVQDPASYAWQDLDVLADVLPGTEALGGLLTALLDAPGEHFFVVACDMPFLHPPLVREILQVRSACDVVVPLREEDPQPLHARYSRRCIPAIQRSIARGGRFGIVDFYLEVVVERVPEAVGRAFGPRGMSFSRVNRLEDLERAALCVR